MRLFPIVGFSAIVYFMAGKFLLDLATFTNGLTVELLWMLCDWLLFSRQSTWLVGVTCNLFLIGRFADRPDQVPDLHVNATADVTLRMRTRLFRQCKRADVRHRKPSYCSPLRLHDGTYDCVIWENNVYDGMVLIWYGATSTYDSVRCYSLLCFAIIHGILWCVWCGMVLCGIVWYDTAWFGVAWYGMVWYTGTAWHGMVWYGMVWYGMVWYGMVWYDMAWHGMVWYGMVWYGMVWYGMVWYTGTAWHSMVWYGMVWYGMAWHGMAWHGMVWYGMVWNGMAWHGMVWYGMIYRYGVA